MATKAIPAPIEQQKPLQLIYIQTMDQGQWKSYRLNAYIQRLTDEEAVVFAKEKLREHRHPDTLGGFISFPKQAQARAWIRRVEIVAERFVS